MSASTGSPEKKSLFRRLPAWVLPALAGLTVMAAFFAFAWFYDEPFPDDTDLVVALPERPENDTDNAAPLLIAAGQLVDLWPKSEEFTDEELEAIQVGGAEMNLEKARLLFSRNQAAWDAFVAAWAKPGFYLRPLEHESALSFAPEYAGLTHLRAAILMREGQVDEALRLLSEAVANLQRCDEPEGRRLFINTLHVYSAQSVLRDSLLAMSGVLATVEQCRSTITLLRQQNENNTAGRFKMNVRTEYMHMRRMLENNAALLKNEMRKLARAWDVEVHLPNRFELKPHRLLREIGDMARAVLAEVRDDIPLPAPPPSPPEKSLIPETVRQWEIWQWKGWRWLRLGESRQPLTLEPEMFGESFRSMWRILLIHKTHNQLAQTALALRAYWLEHGARLPETLAELVPEYLPAVPLDIFSPTPAPIRYDARYGALWSVGPNGTDDGGEPERNLIGQRTDDPTVFLPWVK